MVFLCAHIAAEQQHRFVAGPAMIVAQPSDLRGKRIAVHRRFHAMLKKEEAYYRMYDNPGHCRDCLDTYRDVYNNIRPHWSLIPERGGDALTPEDVYRHGHSVKIPKWQKWAKAARAKLDGMMAEDAA